MHPATESEAASPPLAGLRVLDLTQYLPGPWATWQLTQLGAQVTKVEPPAGDPARMMGARRKKTSQAFIALNRGKDLLTLDLKDEDDRNSLLLRVAQADVLIEGFRPGVLTRLGLGWPVLRACNPRLVLCSLTAYGQQGPHAQDAGHDINVMALSGVLAQTTDAAGHPVLGGLPVGDLFGGGQAALVALLAALLAVQTTGRGRHVDVSMAHSLFASNVLAAANVNAGLREQPGRGMLTGGLPCYGVYATADGRHLAVGALERKHWAALCALLERPDLLPCHVSHGQQPGDAQALEVRRELETIFASATLADWTDRLAGHDCCVSPVLGMEEAMAHPLFAPESVEACADAVEGESLFPRLRQRSD